MKTITSMRPVGRAPRYCQPGSAVAAFLLSVFTIAGFAAELPDDCTADDPRPACAIARGAGTVAPYEDYGKRLRASEEVAPLGSGVFGDQTGLYTGGTEFAVVDIDVPGNGTLPVQLRRRLSIDSRRVGTPLPGFGAWSLDVPYLHGVFDGEYKWNVNSARPQDPPGTRCSQRWSPRTAVQFAVRDIWQGTQLYLPGQGDRELLYSANTANPVPADGPVYRWSTRDEIRLRCTPMRNGYPGEGFVAVDAAGTRYFFDIGVERSHGFVHAGGHKRARVRVWLLASRIEDRHGHWVEYSYTGDRLTRIHASDGREITLSYATGAGYARVQSASAHGRSWQYTYASSPLGGPDSHPLHEVARPDASRWRYTYTGTLLPQSEPTIDPDLPCPYPQLFDSPVTVTVTHPAGAVGSFRFAYTQHYRSGVPTHACGLGNDGSQQLQIADHVNVYSLLDRTVTGPGLPVRTWSYDYERTPYPRQSPVVPCPNCAQTKTVTVTAPDGSATVHTFGVLLGVNEGRLLGEAVHAPGGAVLRRTHQHYVSDAEAAGHGYPDAIGELSGSDDPLRLSTRHRPLRQTVIEQQGVSFTRTVEQFDTGFPRPLHLRRASSLGHARTEVLAYHDRLASWTVGQRASVRDGPGGVFIEQTDYDPVSALPTHRYAFGALRSRTRYHTDAAQAGLPWQFFDGGNALIATLSSYHRGVPRSLIYPDSHGESATVNDHGEITAVTDAIGATTHYAYDAMGRVRSVTYPSGDSTVWHVRHIDFERIEHSQFGLPPGHWQRTEHTGNARHVTYYDGLWQPRLSRQFDSADEAGTRRMVLRRYDHAGREVFASYPQRSLTGIDQSADGIATVHDALGRIVRSQAASELGTLTTTLDYLDAFRTRHTDPRGHSTTTGYQAYDRPTTDWPVLIQAPEGVTTTLVRDRWGQPLTIQRSGLYQGQTQSLTRRYVYDAQQRLCKRHDPEAGWTVFDYDAGHRLAWSAAGLNLSSPSDCQRAQVPAGLRSLRHYDARQRLHWLQHPAGTADVHYSYDPDGALRTIHSDGGTWTYDYNRRRLLETERLDVDGAQFELAWTYDGHANLRRLRYPDGAVLDFNPNALGQARQAGTQASGAHYHPNGALAGFSYGNGIVHSQTLNTRLLPQRRRDTLGAAVRLDSRYDYDRNGNPATITDATPGGLDTRHLVHDGLNRMTRADAPNRYGEGLYVYDALDHLRRARFGGPGGLTLDYRIDANQRMDRITLTDAHGSQVRDYGHDARGNVISRPGHSHQYDRAHRMTQGSGEHHRYDGHGRRMRSQRADGRIVYTVYSRTGTLLYETGSGGQPGCAPADDRIFCHGFDPNTGAGSATRYVHLAGRLIAQISGTDTVYLHTDHLGSPVRRTGPAGAELSRTVYEPYGSTADGQYAQGPGFTGHVTDTASQLHYMQQRYYDPVAMRFMSVDPVHVDPASGGNFNRYWYANNNPVRYIDPDGRQACPSGDNRCMEAPSTKTAPEQPPPDAERQATDSQVVAAVERGRLSDGTRIDMDADEQSFFASPEGTSAGVNEIQTCRICGGKPTTVLEFDVPPGTSAGHTHGGVIEQLPGPHDAPTEVGQTIYAITKSSVYAVDRTAVGNRVRVLRGPMLRARERRDFERRIETWNQREGGASTHCTSGC